MKKVSIKLHYFICSFGRLRPNDLILKGVARTHKRLATPKLKRKLKKIEALMPHFTNPPPCEKFIYPPLVVTWFNRRHMNSHEQRQANSCCLCPHNCTSANSQFRPLRTLLRILDRLALLALYRARVWRIVWQVEFSEKNHNLFYTSPHQNQQLSRFAPLLIVRVPKGSQ